jgi:DNA-binding Lrp family transcriptional regulator
MDSWWAEIDDDLLRVLAGNGVMAPDELARRLNLSEGTIASLLSMLAQDGRVRICLVEAR